MLLGGSAPNISDEIRAKNFVLIDWDGIARGALIGIGGDDSPTLVLYNQDGKQLRATLGVERERTALSLYARNERPLEGVPKIFKTNQLLRAQLERWRLTVSLLSISSIRAAGREQA